MTGVKHRVFYRAFGILLAIVAIAFLLLLIKTEYKNIGDYPQNELGISLCINEVQYANLGAFNDSDGDNSDWIELFNYGTEPINLLGMSIADHMGSRNRWAFPDYELGAGEYLIVWASAKNKVTESGEMHTDFLISPSDTITLYYEEECIDKLHISVSPDVGESVGRLAKEPKALAVLSNITPGKANTVRPISYLTRLDNNLKAPVFSDESGFFDSDFFLTLSTDDEDAIILYTLDGSEPTADSEVYEEPIHIYDRSLEPNNIGNVKTTPNYEMDYYWENTYSYKGTVVRARTLKNGVMSEEVVTNTYFVAPDTDLNVVSLTVDPDEMFDEWDGLYVPGESFYIWKKYNKGTSISFSTPANYLADDKIKAHIEIMNNDGKLQADNDVEIKIMGAASRSNPAKGLKVTMDENNETFDTDMYELLPESEVSENAGGTDSLILRASGSVFNRTMFNDILAQEIVADNLNVTYQAAQPAVLFINGEYWGIHNIREYYGEEYFERHFGIKSSNLALITLNTDVSPYAPELSSGSQEDIDDYLALVEYSKTHDLSVKEYYDYVCNQIDTDSFIDYYIAEIYYGNDDWPGNNFKIWRASQEDNEYGDNKWRPVFYDLDDAFLYPSFNSVEYILTEDYDKEILDGVSIHFDGNREIIIALMQNEEFKTKFFDRFEECLDTVFSSENVLSEIDRIQGIYDSEMTAHFSRWHTQDGWLKRIKNLIKFKYSEADLYTYDRWVQRVETMRTFAKERPDYLRGYIAEYLGK